MQTEEVSSELLRTDSIDNSFDCYGMCYIFNKRAERYGRWINLLKVFGILTPALVGITAISWGSDNKYLPYCISIAIFIMVIQFAFSILAIIYKWDDELSYAFEASQSYSELQDRFRKLGKIPPDKYSELREDFDLLNTEYRLRDQQDSKHNVKEWELRMGMRWALREFSRPCRGCNLTPTSMKSNDCPVCGKFSLKYKFS